jgi:alpha-methylacyl-CoA racemase
MGQTATGALDGSAPYYDVYECADGKHVAIGAVEPEFYAELRRVMGLDAPEWDVQRDRARWPDRKAELAALFRTRSRSEWCDVFEGADACFAPVLSLDEAPLHPHNMARGTFVEVDGVVQPGPAPRFSRTPGTLRRPPVAAGQDTDEVLAEFGFDPGDVARLRGGGVVR